MRKLTLLAIIATALFAFGEIVELIDKDSLESVCMAKSCQKEINATHQSHPWFKESGW